MRRRISSLLLVCAILAALVGGRSARADEIDDAIAGFAGNFTQVEQAIGTLAATGDTVAPKILEALADSRLLIGPDRNLYIKDESGALTDPRTGAVADPAGKLKPVRVNNRVRRAIESAMGQLMLLSADPGQRRNAADTLFRSPDPERLPVLEKALAQETDASVKALLEQARAATLLMIPETTDTEKIAAIETLAARGDQAARVLLGAVAEKSSGEITAAANAALELIDRQLAIWSGVQSVYYGISLGSVLLLAAIGLAITFGVMGVINMAHGEMVMLGAYTTFVVQDLIRSSAPGLFDYSLLIALPLAFLVAGAAGVAIERGIIRFLYGRPLETLLATFGLSLVLQQAVRSIFGPSNREVGNPSWMSGAVDVGGLVLTYNRLWIIVFSIVVFTLLILLLRKTAFGLQMRAVTQSRRMASSMGIRTDVVDALTFGLGSGVAGIAGVALSQIENVSPNLGQSYIVDSFMVVVFGGVGNLWGALVGAVSLGIANKLLEPVAGAVLGKIAVLVLLVLFIQRRPRGLFPIKGRAVET